VQAIQVVLVDRELALLNSLTSNLPTSHVLICIWHINKAVLDKIKKTVRDAEQVTKIYQLWQLVVNSKTEEEYNTHLLDLCAVAPAKLVQYFDQQWIPHAKQFVAVWADQHFHIGQKASSRVESAHAKLKRDVSLGGTSQGSILTLVGACVAVVEDYREGVKGELAADRSHTPIAWQREPLFGDIMRKVSRKAIDLVSLLVLVLSSRWWSR